MVSIGIVGGGAAAVSVLRQLPRDERLQVHLYSDVDPGPGRAYGEAAPTAILNRQVGAMSVSDEWPDEFATWMRDTAPAHLVDGDRSYVPRSFFGDYLRSVVASVDGRVTTTVGRVVDVAAAGGRWAVTVAPRDGRSATTVEHDDVVLALGSSPPADPYRLDGCSGYTRDAYPVGEWLPSLLASDHAAVIGTGLSAVDVALAARAQPWTGHLTMASRNGILPDARADGTPLDFDPEIAGLIRRLVAQRGGLEWEDVRHIVDYLALGEGIRRSEVRAAFRAVGQPAGERLAAMAVSVGSVDPAVQRLVIGVAQHYVNDLWAAMSRNARRTFLATTHPAFAALSNPLPAASARTLGLMLSDGQLSVCDGVVDVAPARHGFTLTFDGPRDIEGMSVPRHTVGHVVNATRTPAGAPSPAAAGVVASLLHRGLAAPNPHGGLRIDLATNQLLDSGGRTVERLYALGEIASGDLYYISSIAKIRRRARAVVRRIVDTARPVGRDAEPVGATHG